MPESFFTPRTLAEYLQVSLRTAHRIIDPTEGEIPSYKIQGSRRIAAEDVAAYLATRKEGIPA